MQRAVVVGMIALLASSLAVAQASAQSLSYGEFALMVVQTVAAADADVPAESQGALDLLRAYGFLPLGWRVDGMMTQGQLQEVLTPTGVLFTADAADAPLDRATAEAVLAANRETLTAYFEDLGGEECTHGEFAVFLVRTITPPQESLPDPETSLDLLKREGLVPIGWLVPEILTHGELADVLARLGVIYETVDRNDPVSVPFVITLLRRELSMVRDYWARRVGHGFSVAHVMDLGVDRAVSPSSFYYRAHVHHRP